MCSECVNDAGCASGKCDLVVCAIKCDSGAGCANMACGSDGYCLSQFSVVTAKESKSTSDVRLGVGIGLIVILFLLIVLLACFCHRRSQKNTMPA